MKSGESNRKFILTCVLLSAMSVVIYQTFSYLTYRLGFPLDDAWIHQTYARNLALRGEWSFIPGIPSAGSTSPLWSVILAPGHFFAIHPVLWSSLSGWGALAMSMWLCGTTLLKLMPENRENTHIWYGCILGFEWHMVWSAVSGMETAAYSLVVLFALSQLLQARVQWLGLGMLVGAAAWLRPDGITLLAPAGLVIGLSRQVITEKLRQLVVLSLGFALVFTPYLLFNQALAGAWWPNTFFAKQAEYGVELQAALWDRLMEQAALPLVGVGSVLLPGFLLLFYNAARRRQWGILAGGLWAAGYLCLYALRLPVTYQHGRYVIPMMPVLFTWGLAGMLSWVKTSSSVMLRRVVSRTWQICMFVVLVIFWLMGGRAFGNDVAFIESEMVNTANWVAHNTNANALVAAHDIGALGFFGQRNLVDLAGLVSVDVIPIIRDEQHLADYMDDKGVDYLVTFPGWYPELSKRGLMVYRSSGEFAIEQGYENMVVYRWLTLP